MARPSQRKPTELASIISLNTAVFEEYFEHHHLQVPSFDKETIMLRNLPKEIQQAGDIVMDATTELQALISGPVGNVRLQTMAHVNLIALQAIYRFSIAKSFPVDKDATYEEISKVCGLDEAVVRRIVRYAMTKYIFKESRPGFVAHTASSKVLAEMPILNDWVGMVCEEMWPAASRTVDAMVKWPGSQEPNHTGFAFANNTEKPTYMELSQFPEREKRFGNAMSLIGTEAGFEHYHLVNAFAGTWDSVNSFVDVGGSHGDASIALAREIPHVHCIVQDLPDVITEGLSLLPEELAGRVEFVANDFFTEQPANCKGADVYYLRWIMHGYSDKYCTKILRRLIPGLSKGSRIIISEFIVPPPGLIPAYQEWMVRGFDLAMLELTNSKEREEQDWKKLFKDADTNFEFIGIKRPEDSKLSFIEVKWKGSN